MVFCNTSRDGWLFFIRQKQRALYEDGQKEHEAQAFLCGLLLRNTVLLMVTESAVSLFSHLNRFASEFRRMLATHPTAGTMRCVLELNEKFIS